MFNKKSDGSTNNTVNKLKKSDACKNKVNSYTIRNAGANKVMLHRNVTNNTRAKLTMSHATFRRIDLKINKLPKINKHYTKKKRIKISKKRSNKLEKKNKKNKNK